AKAVVEERSVRVRAQEEGFLSVQIDERSDIIAADLVLEGVSGLVEMGTGMERFMIAVYEAKDGLHVSFAGPRALTGPGELFRIYPSESAGEVGLLRGHFNGGRIGVRLEGRLIPAVALPQQFALHANAPNPFNAETLIRFDLPTEARVSIEIYNALGQKVRTLLQERRAAGRYQIGWDSRDDAGRALASGVYFYRLIAEEFVQTRRMMLAK
ncbi:MAG: FlgD immunoglobulin-like domain containing protein, partial [Candidatus Latescibacterota bacterium]